MSESNITELTGTVVKKKFGKGSKSESLAYFLVCDDGEEFVIRRKYANPFMDKYFDDYIDKKIHVKGAILDYVFFTEEVKEV